MEEESTSPATTKVYCGGLPAAITEEQLTELFGKFGKISNIEIKNPPRPPAFAFIFFDVKEEADKAIAELHGSEMEGLKLRVELSVSKGPKALREDRDGRDGGGRDGGGGRGGGRTNFRVIVSGMPPQVSWQDLKDFCRQVGEVTYTDVDKMGGGVAEFTRHDAMERAVYRLDDTEIRSRGQRTGCYVRVRYERREQPRGYDDRRGGGRDDYDDRRGGGRDDRRSDDRRGDERRRERSPPRDDGRRADERNRQD